MRSGQRNSSTDKKSRVVTRTIPAIFPNTERSLSFIVSPGRMREGTLTVDLEEWNA